MPNSPSNSSLPAIPDYQVLRRIGRGAYGEVWLVHGITGLFRAAKVVWRDRFTDAGPYEREFRAIRLYAEISLDDPRLLRVLHVGSNNVGGYFYYVMELADDAGPIDPPADGRFDADSYSPRTLRAELSTRGRLPTSEALRVGVDLTQALHSLHSRGLVHRDIKPSNVIFVGGMPKLADVGLVTGIVEARTMVGTPDYQPPAPEKPGLPTGDLYALGKVLYEMATGNSARECPRMPRNEIPQAERSQWLGLNEIILKATEPVTTVRYAAAQDLLKDLLLVSSGSSIRVWRMLQRQARWLKLAAVILFAIAVAAVSIAQVQRRITTQALERLDQARYTAAQMRIAAGRHRDARRFLEEIQIHHGGTTPLEWRLLYGLAFGSPDRVYTGPSEPVTQIVASDDGSRIAAIADGRTLWLWPTDATHGSSNSGPVMRLGPFLGAEREPVRLMETHQGQTNAIVGYPDADGEFTVVSWAPGSAHLLVRRKSSLQDLEVRSASDFSVKAMLRIPANAAFPITKLESVSEDGSTVVFVRVGQTIEGEFRGEIEAWDVASTTLRHRFPLGHGPQGLSVSGDGRRLAIANGTTAAPQLADLHGGQTQYLTEPMIHRGCDIVAFSPDGRRVASGGTDGSVRVWSATDGQLEESLPGHAPSISALTWSPDGKFLFSGDTTGEIRRWQMTPRARVPLRLAGFWNKAFGDFCQGLESSRWAATLADGQVGLWDNACGAQPQLRLANAFEPICFSDRDRVLWTYDHTGWVRSWDVQDGRMLSESGPVVPRGTAIGRIAVDPGRRVAFAVGYDDATLYRWNLATHRLEATATNDFRDVYMLQHVPASDVVVVLCDNDGIYGWNGTDLSRRWTIPGHPHVDAANGLACSRDGRWVAAGSHDGRVRIINVARGRVERTLQAQSSAVLALTFSPDGSSVVVSHKSGLISWVDRHTGRERVQFDLATHQGDQLRAESFRLGFSADGSVLAALTNGGETTTELVRWVAGNPLDSRSVSTGSIRP